MRLGKAGPVPTLESVRSEVSKRYATRLHMSFIVAGSISVGTLVTALLMRLGVDALWLRWLPALACAYLAFFVGVWLWLRLSAYGRYLREDARQDRQSLIDGTVDSLNLGFNSPLPSGGGSVAGDVLRAGGGAFDGGGASASWAGEAVSQVASPPSALADGVGDAAGGALDGLGDDGGLALAIAIALLAVVMALLFGAAAFVIWQAPGILGEVVFEAMLGSPLVRGVKAMDAGLWVRALLARTWKPFALVSAFAMAFAAYAGAAVPQARTAAEVIAVLAMKTVD
jgi:hypothetical protein